MPLISIRLAYTLLIELKNRANLLHLSQTEYIRKAIEHMNEEVSKQEHKQRLIDASLRVRDESMAVNNDFSRIKHDPEA